MKNEIQPHQKAEQVVDELAKMKAAFFECNQDRSLFQLEKFVVGQHDRPERRYLQIITELHVCYMEIRRMLIDFEEAKILADTEPAGKLHDVHVARERLKMEGIEYNIDAKLKEFTKLKWIMDKSEKYTMEQIEKAEAPYYAERLQRQELEEKLSTATHTSVGNMRAMVQAGILEIGKRARPDGSLEMFSKAIPHAPDENESLTVNGKHL